MVLKVIFDTNIWCHLIKENENRLKNIFALNNIKIFGYVKIKEELQKIPNSRRLRNFQKKKIALALYEFITNNKYLRHSAEIDHLALKYYNVYKSLGGGYDWNETNIKVDFSIVACASKFGLDIVYSEDKNSLASKTAQKAYKHVNIKKGYRTPNFHKYSDLKEALEI